MTVPFENDTGNIVRKLARKSLKSEKRRNLMVVIAVALEKGARVVCGGKAHERGGNFFHRL